MRVEGEGDREEEGGEREPFEERVDQCSGKVLEGEEGEYGGVGEEVEGEDEGSGVGAGQVVLEGEDRARGEVQNFGRGEEAGGGENPGSQGEAGKD